MPGWGKGSLQGAPLARRVVLPAARAFAVCFPLTLIVALSSPRSDVVLNTGAPDQGRAGSSQGGWGSTADLPVLGLGGVLTDPRSGEVPSPSNVVAAVPTAPGEGGSFTAQGAPAPFGISSVTTLTSSGIPTRAYQAYLKAQGLQARDNPSCRISWSLIAGIGRVESNHGRFGGAGFAADGRVVPPILGILLDGSRPGTATISDSDHGAYDGSTRWDRAVGPMQFLPGTWSVYGGDGNGDGRRDPQQIDDAAFGTARYLCAGGKDLSTQAGRYSAVFRYNHSDSYVRLVLSLADTYATGRPTTVPDTIPPGGHDGSSGPGANQGGQPSGINDGNGGQGSPSPTSSSSTGPPTTTTRPPTTGTTTTAPPTTPSPTRSGPTSSPTGTPTTTPTTTSTPTPTDTTPTDITTTTAPSTPVDTPTTPSATDTCIVTPDPTDPLATPTVPVGCPTPVTSPVASPAASVPEPTPTVAP